MFSEKSFRVNFDLGKPLILSHFRGKKKRTGIVSTSPFLFEKEERKEKEQKYFFSQREKERGKKKFFFSSFYPEKEEGEKEKREK